MIYFHGRYLIIRSTKIIELCLFPREAKLSVWGKFPPPSTGGRVTQPLAIPEDMWTTRDGAIPHYLIWIYIYILHREGGKRGGKKLPVEPEKDSICFFLFFSLPLQYNAMTV